MSRLIKTNTMKISCRLFLFFVLCNVALASTGSYFVRLTDKGLSYRPQLLANRLEQIQGLAKKKLADSSARFATAVYSLPAQKRFSRWLVYTTTEEENLAQLKAQFLIDYYEDVKIFRINDSSSDSLIQEQWYLKTVGAMQAWQYTKGDSTLIIGVIDTGIDYRHPDLRGGLWVNKAEKYGIPEVDDDQNGFVDDSLGWDFTDAPRFPDSGDYLDQDNDPMDEYGTGHGTQVAGIIAAVNNNRGISGVAPGVRVMNLRAGTAAGYLEEDDVANAILYALDNGARIVNMSFGDVALSRFLKEVIHYAAVKGMVLIASSGNEGSEQPHYPSGLPEVIAVGASTQSDNVAGFSNFGNTIDLVAPGVDMVSTAIGGGYNSVNGTSFSAPVVSAVAGLLLSYYPQYNNEQVRNVLKTSSKDIVLNGWDYYSGAGRVSADRALQTIEAGRMKLDYPLPEAAFAVDTLWLIGTMIHPDVLSTAVSYGLGRQPEQWQTVFREERRQFFSDTLGSISLIDYTDTTIVVRLQMDLLNGRQEESRTTIYIDRTPPAIGNVQAINMFDRAQGAVLIRFKTDDVTKARLQIRKEGQQTTDEIVELQYETRNHSIKLNRENYDGLYSFSIEAKNGSELTTIDDNKGQGYSFRLEDNFQFQPFAETPWQLPSGYLLQESVDLDQDGNKEVILSRYDEQSAFGPVEIYEFEQNRFARRTTTAFTAIPRAAGDVNSNALPDILVSYGKIATVLEVESAGSFVLKPIWQDTTDFWAAGYADSDGDGREEIIGYRNKDYVIMEYTGDNQFQEVAVLPNPTSGTNRFGVPRFVMNDINKDGKEDIIYGDYDGDIIVYTATGNDQYKLLATGKTVNEDATEMLTGESLNPFFAGSHTPDELDYEHEFDARHWSLERFLFTFNPDTLLAETALHFYGYWNTREYDSGVQIHQLDGETLLFVAFYPNLYVFRVEADTLIPVWHHAPARSNTILIEDFDLNGQDEFYFNDGTAIVGFSKEPVNRPLTPYPFAIDEIDSTHIRLHWGSVNGVNRYIVYRGKDRNSLNPIVSVTENHFRDTSLAIQQTYYYAVSAVDSGFEVSESPLSLVDSAYTDYPPRLIGAEVLNSRQLRLGFNQPVGFFTKKPYNIRLKSTNAQAVSAVLFSDRRSLLAAFDKPFQTEITDTVVVENIFSYRRIHVDRNFNSAAFTFTAEERQPYIVRYDLPDRYHLQLYFSESMQKESLTNINNYQLEPNGPVREVRVLDSLCQSVELTLPSQAMAGAFGKASYLSLINMISAAGVELKNSGKINLYRPVNDLQNFILYPQPVRPGNDKVYFANLPGEVVVRIFNIQGKLIKKISGETKYGALSWDLRDENGERLRSGIYIYELIFENEKKYGKLAIVR